MQIVIDITEKQFALMKVMARNLRYRGESTIEQAIAHGIVLPENVTNGDMFKALFPNYIYVGVCVLDENECILLHDVNYHWWNAPYETEGRRAHECKTESEKV
jgi:hypothetical protein